MDKFIPLSVPNLKGNELKYVTEAIETEWVSTAGSNITKFEEQLANYVGSSYAVACQNGTAGLHLALMAAGVSKNAAVLVPTLTFVAAVNPVKYIGADPIFIDCDESLTIDPLKVKDFCENECDFLENKLVYRKTGKKISAIIVVHIFGNMADMVSLCSIADKYKLTIIEDATEALGTYYIDGVFKGKYAGTMGHIGVYSFNGNKIITTGGGGMIVSNNKKLIDRCRHLSTQAKTDTVYFDHDEIGYNYRMTNLQAALGLAQLEQLEKFIQTKKQNYMCYKQKGLKLLDFRKDIRPNYWFYSLITNNRDELLDYLETIKIQTRPIWKLIHTLKPYQNDQVFSIVKATYYYERILNIPCSSNLTKEEVNYVSDMILSFEEEFNGDK